MKNENPSISPKMNNKVGVVIPTYRSKSKILSVIEGIGSEVSKIYIIDDCCPESTGSYVAHNCNDSRVKVIILRTNLGVGGATMQGYIHAYEDKMDVILKIDSDGQMNPKLIPQFIRPIFNGECDYTKGNRFYNIEYIFEMPKKRLIGNLALSFITKLSSGYWNIFDPTNGFTAIHASILKEIPLHKISSRYFFETDMLFRLGLTSAVVKDIPMRPVYNDEVSSLSIKSILPKFIAGNILNTLKRIVYCHFLRDMSIASIELIVGLALLSFGVIFGIFSWYIASIFNRPATAGTVMLATTTLLIGVQLILAFIAYDISSVPVNSIHMNDNKSPRE